VERALLGTLCKRVTERAFHLDIKGITLDSLDGKRSRLGMF